MKWIIVLLLFLGLSAADSQKLLNYDVNAGFASVLPAEAFIYTSEIENTSSSVYTDERGKILIDGINFTAPDVFIEADRLESLVEAKAGWISILPYAYCKPDQPKVKFDSDFQWWGERTEGVIKTIEYARKHGLQVMLKPHVWVIGQGWLGEFNLTSEEAWNEWEQSYRDYILTYANMADSLDVELFCIGTEAKIVVRERPGFWFELIEDVREIYSGKLTYAANWDNYHNIPFWEKLDLIGVDAYFPLSEAHTPTVEDLREAWLPHASSMEAFSNEQGRSIVFTEFGYMSTDQTAWQNWELEKKGRNAPVNLLAQQNAYEALFQTFWEEPWFDGGFLWKWHHRSNSGGPDNSAYTPQRKPALKVIQYYYL